MTECIEELVPCRTIDLQRLSEGPDRKRFVLERPLSYVGARDRSITFVELGEKPGLSGATPSDEERRFAMSDIST